MKDLRELHNKLARLIKFRRDWHKPKKHGEYVFAEVRDGFYFKLDTWSNAITEHLDKKQRYFGMDFGGFEPHVKTGDYIIAIGLLSDDDHNI